MNAYRPADVEMDTPRIMACDKGCGTLMEIRRHDGQPGGVWWVIDCAVCKTTWGVFVQPPQP